MAKLEKLFQPIKIGSLELANRIIMPAISNNYDLEDNDRWANFYARRARGGAGILTIGALQVLHPGRRGCYTIDISDDKYIPTLQRVTRAIRDNGSKSAAQLATYGYWARNGDESRAEDVGPSEGGLPIRDFHPEYVAHRPDFSHAEFVPKVRTLAIEEIELIEEAIGDAAVRAREAGFDAVELQAVGGNLLVRFINPLNNRRNDKYGGNMENRMRLLLNAIGNIKRKVGDDFPLICRFPGLDMVPWGLSLDEWKEIAPLVEKAGVHILNVYPGWHETTEPRHHMCVPRGAFAYLAEAIKQVVDIPVATNIRINDPILAEEILVEEKADLICMGRPLIADPDLPNKAKEGRLQDIRMCTACGHCHEDREATRIMTCTVNAEAGMEAERTITPAKVKRNVFVIGGGPAGMEAARVTALRGHQVTIFEKNSQLGGQLLYAMLPPYKQEWKTLIQYLSTQLQELGIETRLNQECNIETVVSERPDVVILATGAEAIVPDMPGADSPNVVMALEVLNSEKEVGQNVVIIGGGLIGCETAEFLLQQGKRVTILEMLDRIGADISKWNRWVIIKRLREAGIRVETNSKAVGITEKGVRIMRADFYPEFFEADSVVIAAGMKAIDELGKELQANVASLCKVGDCISPNRIDKAIEAGYLAATQV